MFWPRGRLTNDCREDVKGAEQTSVVGEAFAAGPVSQDLPREKAGEHSQLRDDSLCISVTTRRRV